jgi:hypothetical protein
MVRFEDLVFHPRETTQKVCECAGGQLMRKNKFIYIVDSAKKGVGAHGKVRVMTFPKMSQVLRQMNCFTSSHASICLA